MKNSQRPDTAGLEWLAALCCLCSELSQLCTGNPATGFFSCLFVGFFFSVNIIVAV